jgi:hypothetical protein
MLAVFVCFLVMASGQYEDVENLLPVATGFLNNVDVDSVVGHTDGSGAGSGSTSSSGSSTTSVSTTSPGSRTRCAVTTAATVDALNKLAMVRDNAAFLVDSPVTRATLYASLSAFSNYVVTTNTACVAAVLAVAAAARV